MIKTLLLTLLTLAAILSAAPLLHAQATTATGQTQTQGLVQQQNLPPAPTCFTCDCNSQDFDCRTSCNAITNFASRQQCLASCGQQQATCLSNAQVQQRAQDAQRQAAQTTTVTTTGTGQ